MNQVWSKWLIDEINDRGGVLTESLPVAVVGDTVCNHTADSYSHTLLQSGRSPRRGNSPDKPVAGTGCTGHSWECM